MRWRCADCGYVGHIADKCNCRPTETPPSAPERHAMADTDHPDTPAAAAGEALLSEMITIPRDLLECLADDEPCHFDHHGGCQEHGYLSLKPGEKCPHAEAKEYLGRRAQPAAGAACPTCDDKGHAVATEYGVGCPGCGKLPAAGAVGEAVVEAIADLTDGEEVDIEAVLDLLADEAARGADTVRLRSAIGHAFHEREVMAARLSASLAEAKAKASAPQPAAPRDRNTQDALAAAAYEAGVERGRSEQPAAAGGEVTEAEVDALEHVVACAGLWWPEHVPGQETIGFEADLEKARAAVAALRAGAGGWIACSDRMPEAGARVLVWTRYGYYPVSAELWHGDFVLVTDDGYFANDGDGDWVRLDVTHWQPLPAPPAKGEEGLG